MKIKNGKMFQSNKNEIIGMTKHININNSSKYFIVSQLYFGTYLVQRQETQ